MTNVIKHVVLSGKEIGSHLGDRNNCTVVATAKAEGLDYDYAHHLVSGLGRNFRKRFYTSRIAKNRGWAYIPAVFRKYLHHYENGAVIPRCSVGSLLKSGKLSKGRYVVQVRGHVFAVVDGVSYDSGKLRPRQIVKGVYTVK